MVKVKENKKSNPILNIIGIILCIILIPVLVINIALIVKSYTNKDAVPSFGGYMPLIVLTDSMKPTIDGGDLIICHTIEAKDVKVDDIISYFDPEGNGQSIVTHRVKEVVNDENGISFLTQGDANNTMDNEPIPGDKLVGIYQSRIPNAGNVAMFMQTTTGLIVCVVCPLILLIGYDVLRRKMYEKNKKDDTDALLAELEELKKMQANAPQPQDAEAKVEEPASKE